jgi:ABC-type nitrate/sulfonate/bicarbonate transport system ATPase subunit
MLLIIHSLDKTTMLSDRIGVMSAGSGVSLRSLLQAGQET